MLSLNRTPTPVRPSIPRLARRTSAVAVVLAFLACGCRGQQPALAAQPEPARDGQIDERYEAGVVCVGEVVAHTFSFTNNWNEELMIAADGGVTVGCGCTSLTPSARVVAPRGRVEIALAVNTERASGAFAYTSGVAWTGASGRRVEQKLVVAGEAVPLLAVSPDALAFGPGESRSVSKSILVSGNQFVTLTNWRAVAESPAFSVAGIEVVDPRTARVSVTCSPAADLELVAGAVMISAEIVGCQRKIGVREASVSLPVRGGSRPAFAVRPAQLSVALDPLTRTAKGSLLLTGPGLVKESVEAVRCGSLRVTWKYSPAAGGNGVLAIEIEGVAATDVPATIEISVRGKPPVKIPLLVAG